MLVEGRNRDHRSINIAASKRQTDSLHIKKIRCGGHLLCSSTTFATKSARTGLVHRSKSFDDLVGEREQLCWHFQTECFGGLEIDD
jgi:hypothetical protein